MRNRQMSSARTWRGIPRKLVIAWLGIVALGLLVTSCYGTGDYPIDYFPEMHYQASYRPQEPPRLYPPSQSVPVTGRSATLSMTIDQAKAMQNPVQRNAQTEAQAAEIYRINCSQCHGDGHGNGKVAAFLVANGADRPADYTSPDIVSLSDGELFYYIQNGYKFMPAFKYLLDDQETWTVIYQIRKIQGK